MLFYLFKMLKNYVKKFTVLSKIVILDEFYKTHLLDLVKNIKNSLSFEKNTLCKDLPSV